MMVNTVFEHVPIKLENFNDDESSNSNDKYSRVWRASSSSTSTESEREPAAATATTIINSRTSPITTTNLELDDEVVEVESCGNVFIYSRRKLFLICGFCDSKYANMLQFAKHLNDCHKIFHHPTNPNDEEATTLNVVPHPTPTTDDSDSDAMTTVSSSNGLIVKGGFQIRFVGEGSTPTSTATAAKNEDESSQPTPSNVLLSHVPIKVENEHEHEQILEDEKVKINFENNIESCGNIFVMNRKKLFLICGFCESKYANMELFASHLHECHKIFEDDNQANQSILVVVPQQSSLEIKQEPEEVLVSVKRRSTSNESELPMVAIPTVGNEDIIPGEEDAAAAGPSSKRRTLMESSRIIDERASSTNETDNLSDESHFSEEIPSRDEDYFQRGSIHTNHLCKKCPKQFKKLSRMLEHIRIHTGEKPHICLVCGKLFRIKLRLTEHMMRHRDVKAFKCEVCGLGCSTRQDYNLHMRHHKGDKRYSCNQCKKAFVRSSDLKTHLRIHTDERPFKCEICQNTFRANQNLIMHRRMHDNIKLFKCDYCDKRFRRNIDKKVHHRTHTGEKAYKCEICNRGYSAKIHVRQHIQKRHMDLGQVQDQSQPQGVEDDGQTKVKRTRKGIKLFKCTFCLKEYSSKYTLNKHYQKLHADEPSTSTATTTTTTNKDDTSTKSTTTIIITDSPENSANLLSSSSPTI